MKRMAYGRQTAAWDNIESGEHSAGLPLNLRATNRWRLGPVAMAHIACVKSDVLLARDVNLGGRIDGHMQDSLKAEQARNKLVINQLPIQRGQGTPPMQMGREGGTEL